MGLGNPAGRKDLEEGSRDRVENRRVGRASFFVESREGKEDQYSERMREKRKRGNNLPDPLERSKRVETTENKIEKCIVAFIN